MLVSRIRFIFGAMALALIVAVSSPVGAQQRNPDNSVNPTASSVKEEQLLQEFQRIQGRGTIPDTGSYVIEQPAGRDWRHFHQVTLRWIGAIAIIGMLALLVVFYLIRGMVRIESGRSGRVLVRFSTFERFVHWMTAACFTLVAMGEIRPQLPELPVHDRRVCNLPDVDSLEHSEPGRRRMVEGRRRHGRPQAPAGLSFQCGSEDDLLDRSAWRHRGGGERLFPDVPVLRH